MKTRFKEVQPNLNNPDKFPCVGVLIDPLAMGYELAVLFDSNDTGMIIHREKYSVKVGEYRRNWDIKQFRKMRPGEEIIIKG
jgi:hypothetical protein